MGARARLHRASLEPDWLCLVGRISRGNSDAAERRVYRHLRAELPDGTRRLATRPFRNNLAAPAFAGPAPRPGDRSGPPDLCTGPLGRAPADGDADCRIRIFSAHRPAVDPADDEVGACCRAT